MSNEGTTEETVDETPGIGEPETEVQALARRLRNCVDALKELGVDPIALQDDGDDREELLRSAVERGRTLVQHGKKTAEDDARVREQTLRTVLGGAIDGEKSVVDIARRVARDLKGALERPGVAEKPSAAHEHAEVMRRKIGGMFYFPGGVPESGPAWLAILSAVEGWASTLRNIGGLLRVEGATSDDFLRTSPAMVVFDALSRLLESDFDNAPKGDATGPRILIDVIALKCDPVWQHRGIAKVQVQLGTINDIGEWEEADNCAGLQLGRAELVYKS